MIEDKNMEKGARGFFEIATQVFLPCYDLIAGQILDKTKISKGLCLDLGSSGGFLAKAVSDRAEDLKFILLDVDPEAIEIAKEQNYGDKFSYLLANVENIPLADNSVDLVISRGSLWFWKQKQKAFSEIYRVLAKGGWAYFGCGFGSGELKEKVHQQMKERSGNAWQNKIKKIRADQSGEFIAGIVKTLGIEFEMINDERGLWIIFQK